jgi:hypothetical protein
VVTHADRAARHAPLDDAHRTRQHDLRVWERFDEATAAWCFQRLGPDEKPGWLHRRRNEWLASGKSWSAYVRAWSEDEPLHSANTLLRLLDERFQRVHLAEGPYFFLDLGRATEQEERAAIEAGQIRATRVDYVGTLG